MSLFESEPFYSNDDFSMYSDSAKLSSSEKGGHSWLGTHVGFRDAFDDANLNTASAAGDDTYQSGYEYGQGMAESMTLWGEF